MSSEAQTHLARLAKRLHEIAEDPSVPNERVEWAVREIGPLIRQLISGQVDRSAACIKHRLNGR